MSSWREISLSVMRRVAEAHPHASEEELRRLVRAAYPFGARANQPYAAWLKAQREFFSRGQARIKKRPPDDEGQGMFVYS